MFLNQLFFHNVLYVLIFFVFFSNGRVAEECFLRSILLCLQHVQSCKSSCRSPPWTVRHDFFCSQSSRNNKKTKTKNASAKSVVLEGTTEMFLFVRGQEGKKKLKWLLPVGRGFAFGTLETKRRRQHRVPQITVTSHAAFRLRSKYGGVCFLQRGCLRCQKCTCSATDSVGRNL